MPNTKIQYGKGSKVLGKTPGDDGQRGCMIVKRQRQKGVEEM